ncbi:hypothetical protein PVAND_010938 [Polypedilum vanderplanki]|uniref:Anaphase-promoting complex subunit 5 n=1 Tax=Polypedilum vanderplanki TaxID=319348 RepID=A0A9J6CI13_POLVA|nr:hypothetical protein PVAND_010938 [Polypedilum vanderplanki]
MNPKETEVNFFLPLPPSNKNLDISPYKIFVVILLKEYLRKKSDDEELDETSDEKHLVPSSSYPAAYRRQFYMTLLKLSQISDMSFKDLYFFLSSGKYKVMDSHLKGFDTTISLLNKLGIEILFKLSKTMDLLITDTQTRNNSPIIHQSSVVGLYFRRILVYLDKMSFQELMDLQRNIITYYEKGMRALAFSNLQTPLDITDEVSLMKSKWSSKQAEIFIAQQSSLLENDESKALKPKELQKKIEEIVQTFNPLYSKAYFLSYLNNVRIRDLPNCIEALHRSFDRNIAKTATDDSQNQTNKSHFQYSLLNLAILHTMFEQNEEALKCLKECIMTAQESGDRVCLQLAQLWLCLLDKKNFQLSEKNIANKTEKTLVRSVSLNIQSLVKVAALSGYLPSKLFDVLIKSDMLNCQHSIVNLISNCIAERAALWTLYGKHEMASLCSQLLLNSNLKIMDKTYNGEGLCQAMCNVAMWHAYQGDFAVSGIILQQLKLKFPRYPVSKNWFLVDNFITSFHAIYNERWSDAAKACDNIYHIDKNLSILQRANINIARGNLYDALSFVDILLDEKNENLESYYRARAMVIQAMCIIDAIEENGSKVSSKSQSLLILNRASVFAREKYLDYEHSIISMHIGFVFLSMNMPNEALKAVKLKMEDILANGGIYDKGKVLFLFNQCLIAATNAKDKKIEKLKLLKDQFDLAISYFTKLECWRKVKAIYVYLAKLCNELGMTDERNHYSYKFRLLAEEHVNSSNENINIFY